MANLKNSTVADGTIELPDHGSAPSPTAGALYANTTSLYWEDNDLVSGGGGGSLSIPSGSGSSGTTVVHVRPCD